MWLPSEPLSDIENEFFSYDAFEARGQTDLTDESLASTSTSSPTWSVGRNLLGESDEDYDASMDFSPLPRHEFLPDFAIDPFGLGGGFASGGLEGMSDRHHGGRHGGASNPSRRQRIQDCHPYRRSARGAPMVAAPHSAHGLGAASPHEMAGFDVVYARLSPPSRSPSPPAHEQIGVHPSDLTIGPHSFPDAGPHLRAALGLPHGAPVSLWSLTEPPSADIKPCVPYPMLMQLAIYGSEEKRLTLQGIYNAIAERFAYFREQDSMGILSWRKSMRHALSLYSVFVKIPKPLDMDIPGKGCAWILNISAINGSQYSRARKRRGSKSKSAPTTEKKAVGTRQRKSKYVEDASDCTSVSDVDESNLYPDFRQDRSVSPSVSSSMADASSSASAIGESATRVSSRLRSHSAATKKAANRGRRSRTLI